MPKGRPPVSATSRTSPSGASRRIRPSATPVYTLPAPSTATSSGPVPPTGVNAGTGIGGRLSRSRERCGAAGARHTTG
jgi:hypothetical protein